MFLFEKLQHIMKYFELYQTTNTLQSKLGNNHTY